MRTKNLHKDILSNPYCSSCPFKHVSSIVWNSTKTNVWDIVSDNVGDSVSDTIKNNLVYNDIKNQSISSKFKYSIINSLLKTGL